MCQSASVGDLREASGRTIEADGHTTARPPEQPVPMGVLAGLSGSCR
jgi:hypothetical protein